jgi:hypothetical protein
MTLDELLTTLGLLAQDDVANLEAAAIAIASHSARYGRQHSSRAHGMTAAFEAFLASPDGPSKDGIVEELGRHVPWCWPQARAA